MSFSTVFVIALGAAAVGFLLYGRRPKTPLAELRRLSGEGARMLDVRTPGEFTSGHLPGAKNIPVQELAQRAAELGEPSKPVIVYCHSGSRSMIAAGMLRKAGYSAVHDLGAMSNWR